jgi:hypothetical protein
MDEDNGKFANFDNDFSNKFEIKLKIKNIIIFLNL